MNSVKKINEIYVSYINAHNCNISLVPSPQRLCDLVQDTTSLTGLKNPTKKATGPGSGQ